MPRDDRHEPPRLSESVRIVWAPEGGDSERIDRLGNVRAKNALVLTDSAPPVGTEIPFELLDHDDGRTATGTARVKRLDSRGGVVVEFVRLEEGRGKLKARREKAAPEKRPARKKKAAPTEAAHPYHGRRRESGNSARPAVRASLRTPASSAQRPVVAREEVTTSVSDSRSIPPVSAREEVSVVISDSRSTRPVVEREEPPAPADAPASASRDAPAEPPGEWPDISIDLEDLHTPDEVSPAAPAEISLDTPDETSPATPDRIQLDTTRRGVIIGIDLGTSNTCASYVLDGRSRTVPTRAGTNTTPSVVNVEESGLIVVGQRAAARQILEPHRTVYGSKRLLGRTYRPAVAAEYQAHFAYPIVEVEDQRYGAELEGGTLSMRAVATRILEEVRANAEAHLDSPIDGAVITVPAHYSEVQRNAVRDAAAKARIHVHRIVNEPTAAAVAWGHGRDVSGRLAVWDLGGGTFDFSLVDLSGGGFEVLATGGDCFLGGVDLDDAIASLLLERFQDEHALELEPSPQQLARLRESAEQAKRALSAQVGYRVLLTEFTVKPTRHLKANLTRADLDEVAAPLLTRMCELAEEVLASCGLQPADVNEVLLVGGMTRALCVQDAVEELFGKPPSRRINPDEAVAIGAALLASSVDDPGGPRLCDVLPMSMGFAGPNRLFRRVIGKNTSVPIERSLMMPVEPDVDSVSLPLFQGEEPDATLNEYLCTVIVEELPSSSDDRRIEIVLALDEQCRLTARALDPSGDRELPIHLDRSKPVEDVLSHLGSYDGPESARAWRHPPTRIGRLFGKLRKLLG